MEVDEEFCGPPTPLKMQLIFYGGSFQPLETAIVFPDISSIHRDERGIALFLNSFVRSSADVVTVVRFVSVKLSGMNADGSRLVPENEAVFVTKLGQDPRAFSYESTANDIIPTAQFGLLTSFIGSHPTTPWLISVLRVLSELVVKSFGRQG